jgi:phosphonate transport system ATP-binding protein
MALAHFARIVGLRDGTMQFDLPAARVSDALLEQLYAQRDDPAPGLRNDDDAPRPAALQCR